MPEEAMWEVYQAWETFKGRIPDMSLMHLHCSMRLKNLYPVSPQDLDT